MVIGLYKYGMRLRPYGIGCQPTQGFVCCADGAVVDGHRYHNFIYYAENLSKEDVSNYELDYIGYTLMEINEK